ncbi:MAG: hypothetical protein IPP13_11970 [Kouleothrix sp.]|nr:hypothetical protein [Kouleothrix sp.]
MLGWDNREKIAALKHESQARERELQQVRGSITANEQKSDEWKKRQQGLRDLLDFESYADLNWRADEQQIATFQAQQRELERSADHLQQLQQQLDELGGQIKAAETTLGQLQALIGTRESDLRNFQRQRAQSAAQVIDLKPAPQPLVARIEAVLKGTALTLETIDGQQSETERY